MEHVPMQHNQKNLSAKLSFTHVQASWETSFFTLFVEHLFMMYTGVSTSLAQYSFEKCLQAISMMVRFFLSTTPFFVVYTA